MQALKLHTEFDLQSWSYYVKLLRKHANSKVQKPPSLRSWRYCVIKVLAAELRSKKKEWGRGRSWRLRRQLSLDLYSGSAAKFPSPSTQYRNTASYAG